VIRNVLLLHVLVLAWCLVMLGSAVASEGPPTRVKLTLRETAGVPRRHEPVTTGVALPRGVVSEVGRFRLVRASDGSEVPAQFRVAGRWLPGDSIRWVLVDFQADLRVGETENYVLEFGPGGSRSVAVDSPVKVREEKDRFIVETGAASFLLSRHTFNLFESVALADGTVLVDPKASASSGGVLRGIGRTVTRAIPDPANKGTHHLIYVEASPDAPAEDWTLTFTNEEDRFELVGSLTGPDGVGVAGWGREFRSNSGRLILPKDAWLVERSARQGDSFTFSTVPAGSVARTRDIYSSRIRERGPLRTVIEFKGSIGPEHAPVLEFTAWYHFYAGSARVRVDLTLENNDHSGRTDTGNVSNADIGTPNTVFFDEFALRLPVQAGRDVRWTVLGDIGTEPLTRKLRGPMALYQDSSGTDHWDRYRDPKYHPRPNSYVTFQGYRIYREQKPIGGGRQAVGWLDLYGSAGGVGVTVRDFWQNFPKSLGTDGAGVIEVGLFPGRYGGVFPLRPGEHKTHRMLFDFHGPGGSAEQRCVVARAFSAPLLLEPSPEWWARTEVLGVLHPYDPEHFPAYEVRNLSTVGVFPEGFQGERRSLLGQIEAQDFYGWMDYGDVPMDFEAETGQWNLKYDFDLCMLRQYARTGRREWLGLFRAAVEHAVDIDVFHAPHYPELHYLRGGNWAHSLHDEPGHKNPHRNYNHFTRDLSFETRGPAAYYYLRGDWKAFDTVVERAENALARYMSPQEEPPEREYYEVGWRGHAGTLQRLLEGYLLTGDERFRRRAQWCVKERAFDGRVAPGKPLSFSVWSMAFYAMALRRYCALFPEDGLARKTFLAHADALVKSVDPAGKDGACYALTLHSDGSFERKGTCSHYNIMIADVLAYAFRMTGDRRYLEAAGNAFPYGVKNACWVGGPATYSHVHSAAGSTHGSVYMSTVSQERR